MSLSWLSSRHRIWWTQKGAWGGRRYLIRGRYNGTKVNPSVGRGFNCTLCFQAWSAILSRGAHLLLWRHTGFRFYGPRFPGCQARRCGGCTVAFPARFIPCWSVPTSVRMTERPIMVFKQHWICEGSQRWLPTNPLVFRRVWLPCSHRRGKDNWPPCANWWCCTTGDVDYLSHELGLLSTVKDCPLLATWT